MVELRRRQRWCGYRRSRHPSFCHVPQAQQPQPQPQGTNDQSRYLSFHAALQFVDERLGGLRGMRDYNTAMARCASALLVDAWKTGYLTPPELTPPFLVAVALPFDYRAFVRVPERKADGTLTGRATNALGLSGREAQAAAAADGDLNERVATLIWRASGVQPMCFLWKFGGEPRLWCRVSAQVYTTLDDYARLADAVLQLAAAPPPEL